MAHILEQSEIDALLNQSIAEDVPGQSSDESLVDTEGRHQPRKHFKAYARPQTRFQFEYQSPVYKRKEVVVNPNPASRVKPGQAVVRSLENYQAYLRTRKHTADQQRADPPREGERRPPSTR